MVGIVRNTAAIALLALTSCGIITGANKRAKNPLHDTQKMINPTTGKEVVFIRMRHLGPEASYKQVRQYLDRLKESGYVTFSESVQITPYHTDTIGDVTMDQIANNYRKLSREDSLRLDTLIHKCRRVMGFMLNQSGYIDTTNLSLKTKNSEKKYVNQTNKALGQTTNKDIWVDYSLSDLVEIHEKKYGEIELTPYDWQTGLYDKYEPEKQVSQHQRSYFMLFSRNDFVVKRIAESKHQKIAVVYGAAHSYGIIYFLKKNHGFKIDRKFKAE